MIYGTICFAIFFSSRIVIQAVIVLFYPVETDSWQDLILRYFDVATPLLFLFLLIGLSVMHWKAKKNNRDVRKLMEGWIREQPRFEKQVALLNFLDQQAQQRT